MIKTSSEKKKRFIIYTRCSTDEQAQGNFTTLDVQNHHCKNMLDALGYESVRTIKDDGYSGKDLKRPGMQSILKEITPGNTNRSFDGIIFLKLDRLTRNPRDLYGLIDLFKEHNIDFVSVRENLDSSSAIGRVVIGIIGLLSAFERELTGERVKSSALARLRQGKWMGSRLAYGYKRIADGAPLPSGRQPHKIVIDKPIAKELRSMWEMAAGNKSLMLIAKELEKLGIKSPAGKAWRKQSILNILRNPFYKGLMRWNKELHKGNYEALINVDLWDRANKMLGTKLPKHRFAAKPKTYIYLLEGLIKCGKCGSRFISTHSLNGSSQGKFYYYVCGRTKQGLGCDNKPLPAQTFDQAIIDYLKKSSSDPKMLLRAIHQAITEAKEKLSQTNKNLRKASKRLIDLKSEAGKLLNLATKGIISKGITYKSQMEKVEQDILTLEELIDKLNAQKNVATAAIDSSNFTQELIITASENLTTRPPEAQKIIIQSLIKEITVYDDKLEIDLFTSAKPLLRNLSDDIHTNQKRLTPKSKALTANHQGLRNRKDWLPL